MSAPTLKPLRIPTDAEKETVHDAARTGKPLRVPLGWGVNSRIVVLDPSLNPEGYTYEQLLSDPTAPAVVQSRFQEYCHTVLSQSSDVPAALPDEWGFSVEHHNTYDGGYFGGTVESPPGQVPDVKPFLAIDDADEFMKQDFVSRPLENPYIKRCLAFREEIGRASKDFTYLGRKGKLLAFCPGCDGPLTIGAVLFGSDIFALMAEDPDKARELLLFITRGVAARTRALRKLAGQPEITEGAWIADDSIQLISTEMFIDIVEPAHELWYRETSTTQPEDRCRWMHCCGDATRHFKTIAERLGVVAFDTGFPVDHGALRRELGPDISISGGPHVSILSNGTPEQCYEDARRILQSGVMEGGKFSLREGNNLPPCCPQDNLQAVYAACLEYGWYDNEAKRRWKESTA